MKSLYRTPLALAVAVALTSPLAAYAQQPDAPVAQQRALDEVVVTAQRRQESVQDIPIAVSAFDADQLGRLGVTETLDMTRLVPNFIGSSNTGLGTANVYSIRGLNNTESIPTFDPPVGSYIDDIYVSRQNANNFTLFDVDRIEVLRGPQGTLFGRNTTGGAVNVIMARPSEEFGGYVEVGYGRFNRKTARASVDLPVNDQFLTKISGYWIEDDGWLYNETTGETLNFEDNKGVRVDLRWLPTDEIIWDVAVDYVDTQNAAIAGTPVGSNFVTQTGLRRGENLSDFVDLTGNKSFIPTGNLVRAWSITSRLNIATALGDLELITGYRDMNQKYMLDFFNNPAPFGGFVIANDGEHTQFSQEIKLAGSTDDNRIDYVVGVFYLDEDNDTDFADVFNLGFPALISDRTLDNNTETWAVYGQADFHLNDAWTATVGLRYTEEEQDIRLFSNQPNFVGASFDSSDLEAVGVPLSDKTTLWTPRVALQYNIDDDTNVYASATRGFKSGGWNARNNDPLLVLPFGPERVWSYEAGMRSQWMDNRVRFNATAFWTDVSDFQLPTATTDAQGGINFVTRNFADLEVKGLEVELLALATDRLTIYANLGWQDSEYKNLDPAIRDQQQLCLEEALQCGEGIIAPDGSVADPVRAPNFTIAAGGDYRLPLGPRLELVPSLSITRYGTHSIDTGNASFPGGVSYTNVNGGIALEDVDGTWAVRANCKNCTSRVQPNSSLAGGLYYNQPRTWTINFRYNF